MTTFRYTAIDPDGQKLKATIEGVSLASAENELLRRNLTVVKISEKKSLAAIEVAPERVPRQEIMHFSRQVAAFVRTGIPIVDAVRVVEEGTESKRFKAILSDVGQQLEEGVPFSEALAPYASVFPSYYLGILRSAELTGQLDTVLDQLSLYIERDMEARSKVKSALTYPMVIMVMSVLTVFVLAIFVLPKFVDFFDELGSELPLPTRMLLGFAEFMGNWWWVLFLLMAAVVIGFFAMRSQTAGRRILHRFYLRLPVIGVIVQYSAIERFCRIISAMIRAGVPLPEAMAAAIESTNNQVFEDRLRIARDEMLEGDGVAGPLERSELFPPAAVQMVRVGEETGTLDTQIDSAAAYYAREMEYKLKRLTDLFEPAVIIFMGLVVGFVAVALISAMYGGLQDQQKDL